ncbi:hypothetical protein BV378_36005 [Nostoc sp. RF31YmG]|nr:hypothetical protein BV378_36005 [Nostoc sp. RF31YmG]
MQQTNLPNASNILQKNYGDNFQLHLLEQYKMYVEMMDRISNRRSQANSFYISLLTGLLALISLVSDKNLFNGNQNNLLLIVAMLGIFLCFSWYVNIRSYKQLNSLKFKVIHEMEQYLPFPCYDKEWEILKKEKNNSAYLRLTKVEQYVPFALATPYVCLLIYSITSLVK